MAQNPISGISISMAGTMPANISDWATTMPPVTIQANIRTDNRSVQGYVKEAKILVTIKSGSGKICGAYTPTNAPDANITSLVKLYRGAEIEKLLGQTCTLTPGAYTLCVQFFANPNGTPKAISEEICKQFTVKGNDVETYTPPQNVMPADGKVFTAIEAKQPLTFRWTPIVPRPQSDVIYKLRVFEVRKGQSASEAMKTGNSLVEKEVVNQTQWVAGSISSLVIASDSKYGWYVEATDKQGNNLGHSGVTEFGSGINSLDLTVKTQGECKIQIDSLWINCRGYNSLGQPSYDFKIYYSNGSTGGTTYLGNGLATDPLTGNKSLLPTVNGSYLLTYPLGGAVISALVPSAGILTTVAPGSNVVQGVVTLTDANRCITFDLMTRTLVTEGNRTSGNNCESLQDTCLPICYCKDCENPKLINATPVINSAVLVNPSVASFLMTGNIVAGPNPIYSVEVQLESLNFSATPGGCGSGISAINNSGVISIPTVSGSNSGITIYATSPGSSGIAKAFKWKPSSAISATSGLPFQFNLGVPSKPTWAGQGCCTLNYKACFKIIIEYAPCRYCTYFVCKNFTY